MSAACEFYIKNVYTARSYDFVFFSGMGYASLCFFSGILYTRLSLCIITGSVYGVGVLFQELCVFMFYVTNGARLAFFSCTRVHVLCCISGIVNVYLFLLSESLPVCFVTEIMYVAVFQ